MRICRDVQFIDLSIRLGSTRKQTLDKWPLRLIYHQLVAASIDLNRSVVVSHSNSPRRPDTVLKKGLDGHWKVYSRKTVLGHHLDEILKDEIAFDCRISPQVLPCHCFSRLQVK